MSIYETPRVGASFSSSKALREGEVARSTVSLNRLSGKSSYELLNYLPHPVNTLKNTYSRVVKASG